METSIIISGFGGQGALFAGQLLAYAGMDNGRFVTWIPSYGPEMRGGTAHCIVIISDVPIGAPIVRQPDIAIAFNQPSFEKYDPLVKPGGLFIVNSSIVDTESQRTDIDCVYAAANGIAEEFGNAKMMNMVMLGALVAQRPILSLDMIKQALHDHLPVRKHKFLPGNLLVLQRGYEIGLQRPKPV